jgi:hypothetical protein
MKKASLLCSKYKNLDVHREKDGENIFDALMYHTVYK